MANSKTKKRPVVQEHAEESEEVVDVKASKIKKAPEVDLHDDIVGPVEEKPEVDPLLATDETDDPSSDETTMDEEEIDPFGDKWEV